jgi:hypothetical protein
MNQLLGRLNPKERRGSKPRCHLMTHGASDEVAMKLTALIAPFGNVSKNDSWMPVGFADVQEAELNKSPRLLSQADRYQLGTWWLPADRQSARTPNFDIASTCTIGDAPGLLLIEAKAHAEELRKEAVGRIIQADSSDDRKASHGAIGKAIASAAEGLSLATNAPCRISRDTHYQMSNRFAWAWKLTQLGIPVILVYLGFLHANEMKDRGKPFDSDDEWKDIVRDHSASLFGADPWEKIWNCGGHPLVPLIRSIECDL